MRKNYLILEVLAELRMTQAELTKQAGISSEARLSRIIHYLVLPTKFEIESISKVLGIKDIEIGRNRHEVHRSY